jgi:hypothetical protein
MSNICEQCSKFKTLSDIVPWNNLNYRFNMWINDTERPLFLIWSSIIPDIFRKCFSKNIIDIETCKNICPYYYYYKDATNYNLGYAKRIVQLISENEIKALFYNGYSTPSFGLVESINKDIIKLTNSDVIKFNNLIATFNTNILNKKLSIQYLDNHQVTFFDYFNIKYPSYTLISQYINFIFKALKTYNYLLENKTYLCKTDIYWEYTLECNSKLHNKIGVKINESSLSQLYILLQQYTANNYITYDYYQSFFDTIRYALEVYSDIYNVYSKNYNSMYMPLYNKMNNKMICIEEYMNNNYKEISKNIYNIYITNKSQLYTNKILGPIDKEKNKDITSILVNIIFVKISPIGISPIGISSTLEYFKENYPILDYTFIDNHENIIDTSYFLEKGDKLEIDLSKITGFICWNYFNDIFLNTKQILKNFNYNNKIDINVYDNICIYIFYI